MKRLQISYMDKSVMNRQSLDYLLYLIAHYAASVLEEEKPSVTLNFRNEGQWMRDWQERMEVVGTKMVSDGLAVQNTPDEEGIVRCKELGARLAAVVR